MLNSQVVHMMNRFPGCRIDQGETYARAYDPKTSELLSAVHSVHGIVCEDASQKRFAKYGYSMEPLPKNARFEKDYGTGDIRPSEEHDERRPVAEALQKAHGYVPSTNECKALGYKVDRDGNVDISAAPEPKAAPKAAPKKK